MLIVSGGAQLTTIPFYHLLYITQEKFGMAFPRIPLQVGFWSELSSKRHSGDLEGREEVIVAWRICRQTRGSQQFLGKSLSVTIWERKAAERGQLLL